MTLWINNGELGSKARVVGQSDPRCKPCTIALLGRSWQNYSHDSVVVPYVAPVEVQAQKHKSIGLPRWEELCPWRLQTRGEKNQESESSSFTWDCQLRDLIWWPTLLGNGFSVPPTLPLSSVVNGRATEPWEFERSQTDVFWGHRIRVLSILHLWLLSLSLLFYL